MLVLSGPLAVRHGVRLKLYNQMTSAIPQRRHLEGCVRMIRRCAALRYTFCQSPKLTLDNWVLQTSNPKEQTLHVVRVEILLLSSLCCHIPPIQCWTHPKLLRQGDDWPSVTHRCVRQLAFNVGRPSWCWFLCLQCLCLWDPRSRF